MLSRKTFLQLCAPPLLIAYGVLGFSMIKAWKIKSYAEQHLEQFIKEQEEQTKLQYSGKPQIKMGLDNGNVIAWYNNEQDTIKISVNLITTSLFLSSPAQIRDMIRHELGHFYIDKLLEELTKKGVSIHPDRTKLKTLLITEGIAEYFRQKGEMPEVEIDYQKLLPELQQNVRQKNYMYGVGYHLVRPIIDGYRKEGIEYLLTHPLREQEIDRLYEYQQKILRGLLNDKSLI